MLMASTFMYQFLSYFDKIPCQSKPNTLIPQFLAALKPLKPLSLVAFETIFYVGPLSWRMGLFSWKTLTVFVLPTPQKHEFQVQAALMCKWLHLPHTLSLKY